MFLYRQVSLYLFLHALFRDAALPVGNPPTRKPQTASIEIRRSAILFDTIHDNIQNAGNGEYPDYSRLGYVLALVRLKVPSFQRVVWSTPSAKETEEVGSSETFVLL